jgi:hypothetical protein
MLSLTTAALRPAEPTTLSKREAEASPFLRREQVNGGFRYC